MERSGAGEEEALIETGVKGSRGSRAESSRGAESVPWPTSRSRGRLGCTGTLAQEQRPRGTSPVRSQGSSAHADDGQRERRCSGEDAAQQSLKRFRE